MIIQDARWETPQEKQRRSEFHASFNRKEDSIKWCDENYEKLIKWHNEFSIDYPNKLKEREVQRRESRIIEINDNNRIFEEIKNGVAHYCPCGGQIRYVQSHDFCGCERWQNKLIFHKSYNLMYYDPDTPMVIEIGKNYLNEFKRKYAIPAMSSIVFKTLRAHGVELLCEINEDYFNVGRNASYQSKTEEAMVLEILTKKFPKCVPQQGVKIFDGKKWHLRIPDYICMGNEVIYVFDAKLAMRNTNDAQLKEYHVAVEIIAEKQKMPQRVASYFILYDTEDYSQGELERSRCFSIPMLRAL